MGNIAFHISIRNLRLTRAIFCAEMMALTIVVGLVNLSADAIAGRGATHGLFCCLNSIEKIEGVKESNILM